MKSLEAELKKVKDGKVLKIKGTGEEIDRIYTALYKQAYDLWKKLPNQ